MKYILNLLAFALLSTGLALAADTKTEPKPKAKAPAKSGESSKAMHLPLRGTVVAITTRTLTLKGGEGKEDRKFTINKDTEILKGEAAAATTDVKVGQAVTGSYVKNADSSAVLTKLQIAPKPAEPKKTAKKGEEGTKKKTEGDTKKKAG